MNLEDEGEGDGEPTCIRSPYRIVSTFTCFRIRELRSTANTSSRTRAVNIVERRGQVLLRI